MRIEDVVKRSVEEREPKSPIVNVVRERNGHSDNSLVSKLMELVRNPLISENEVALAYDLVKRARVTKIKEFPDDEVKATRELLYHIVVPESTWGNNNEFAATSSFIRRLDSIVCKCLMQFCGGIPPPDHKQGEPPERVSVSLCHVDDGFLRKRKKWVALGYYLVRDPIGNVKNKIEIKTKEYNKMFEAARAA